MSRRSEYTVAAGAFLGSATGMWLHLLNVNPPMNGHYPGLALVALKTDGAFVAPPAPRADHIPTWIPQADCV